MYQKTRFALLLGLLLLLAGYFLPYWRPEFWLARSELHRLERRLSEQGRPVRFSDLGKDKDYSLGDFVMQRLPERSNLSWSSLYDPNLVISEEDVEPIKMYYAEHQQAIDEIFQIQYPQKLRYRYDYATCDPSNILLPHVDKVQGLMGFLSAWLLLKLKNAEYADAFDAWNELIDCDQLLAQDRFISTQVARARAGHRVLNMLQILLEKSKLTEEQLEEIDSRLAILEQGFRLEPAIDVERCSGFTMIENLSVNKPRYGGWRAEEYNRLAHEWETLRYRPKLMRQQVLMVELYDQVAECIDDVSMQGRQKYAQAKERFDELEKTNPDSYLANNYFAFDFARRSFLCMRQRIITAQFAVRALRFRSLHGVLPVNLQQLSQAANDLPLDSIENGQALQAIFSESAMQILAPSEYDATEDFESSGEVIDPEKKPRRFLIQLHL